MTQCNTRIGGKTPSSPRVGGRSLAIPEGDEGPLGLGEGACPRDSPKLPGVHQSLPPPSPPFSSSPPLPGEPGPPQGECNAGLVVNCPKLGCLLTFIQTKNTIGWEGPWQRTGQSQARGWGMREGDAPLGALRSLLEGAGLRAQPLHRWEGADVGIHSRVPHLSSFLPLPAEVTPHFSVTPNICTT